MSRSEAFLFPNVSRPSDLTNIFYMSKHTKILILCLGSRHCYALSRYQVVAHRRLQRPEGPERSRREEGEARHHSASGRGAKESAACDRQLNWSAPGSASPGETGAQVALKLKRQGTLERTIMPVSAAVTLEQILGARSIIKPPCRCSPEPDANCSPVISLCPLP